MTANYDNLFSYVGVAKELTIVPNSIGMMNMYQLGATPGPHGGYGFYDVADFTGLNGGLGVGMNVDAYFKDTSSNANLTPAVAVSATTLGAANWTTGVDGVQSVVVHDGAGLLQIAGSFVAPGNFNLGGGTIAYDVGFYGFDQHALGTTVTAAFAAAPQTAPGYGFYSAPGNSDLLGNLTVQSLTSTGGPLVISQGGTFNGVVTATGLTMQHQLMYNTTPTISSGFGTGASVAASNGPAAFRVNVGTSNTGTGVVGLPTATTGWNCYANNITTKGVNQASVQQTASTTNSATFQNYTDIMGTHAMTDNDVLAISCFAY